MGRCGTTVKAGREGRRAQGEGHPDQGKSGQQIGGAALGRGRCLEPQVRRNRWEDQEWLKDELWKAKG